jgi:hypothetical protein
MGGPNLPATAPPPAPPAARNDAVAAALVAPVEPAGAGGPALPDVAKSAAPVVAAGAATAVATKGVEPQELKPQVAKKRPPPVHKTKPSKKLRAGDLVCGECGEGNSPTRKFCSRCGANLETAVAVKTPWWRKIIPRRKPKTMEAGARPGQKGVKSGKKFSLMPLIAKLRPILAIVFLICGILYGINAHLPGMQQGQGFRDVVNSKWTSIKNKFNKVTHEEFVHVTVVGVKATSETPPDNGAQQAVDTFTNTAWYTPPQDAAPTITITFDHAADLKKLRVNNGDSQKFSEFFRPKTLHLVYSTGESQDITLVDSSTKQDFTLHKSNHVTSVEVHVTAMYPTADNQPHPMALTELEFFQPK